MLILDEPTTGLDPLVRREFLTLLEQAADRGTAVLFSSHVLPEVERIASWVVSIRAGRVISWSTVDYLLDRARRRMELRFAAPCAAGLFDDIPGVATADVHGRTAVLAIDGPVGPALLAATDPGTMRPPHPALIVLVHYLGGPDPVAQADRLKIKLGRAFDLPLPR